MLFQTLYQYDVSVFNWINHWPHPGFLNTIASLIHYGTRAMLIYIILYLGLLVAKKYREAVIIFISMISASFVVSAILKHLIHRPRPFTVLASTILLSPISYSASFPSSETATAFAVAMACHLLFKNKWWRLMWVWAVIAGVDRIYMGQHYPSDVFVGALVGIILSYLIVRLTAKANTKKESA
jgi:undecaprenyl-diphosphatase